MNEKEIIQNLVDYIHNVLDFVDTEELEDVSNVSVINDGYKNFVEPAMKYLQEEDLER